MNSEHKQEQKNEPITVHLKTQTRFFVGKKPIKLFMGEDEIPVNKWREVVRILLKRCNREKHNELLSVRNKIIGMSRTILSDSGNGMDKPAKIDENIYFEIHFGTDTMLNNLFHIFDAIDYDYKDFLVTVKNSNLKSPQTHKDTKEI